MINLTLAMIGIEWATKTEAIMEKDFKDPYNVFYFIGFLLALLLPTLPATLTWIKIISGTY